MCEECGCGDLYKDSPKKHDLHQEHRHHDHREHHEHESNAIVPINVSVLKINDEFAARNRQFFSDYGLLAINLISSPGSGKTTLLQQMAARLGKSLAVVVGDIQTRRDADRILGSGSGAFQIETGGACHLDAHSVGHALQEMEFGGVDVCVIENVGNLVCPAAYDLGEAMKIAILSTPEGDDKVLKYPAIFSRISVLLINKMDIADRLDFDVEKVTRECRSLNVHCDIFKIAAKTGLGVDALCEYLKEKRKKLMIK
jgi:hydrogenase nickel incorporation protein HypB